jgi:hypothetical protein
VSIGTMARSASGSAAGGVGTGVSELGGDTVVSVFSSTSGADDDSVVDSALDAIGDFLGAAARRWRRGSEGMRIDSHNRLLVRREECNKVALLVPGDLEGALWEGSRNSIDGVHVDLISGGDVCLEAIVFKLCVLEPRAHDR